MSERTPCLCERPRMDVCTSSRLKPSSTSRRGNRPPVCGMMYKDKDKAFKASHWTRIPPNSSHGTYMHIASVVESIKGLPAATQSTQGPPSLVDAKNREMISDTCIVVGTHICPLSAFESSIFCRCGGAA
jgi:hypothetical protein